MKFKCFKYLVLSTTALVMGTTVFSNNIKKVEPLFAVQHENNYDAFTYSGSYYSNISSSLSGGLDGNLRKALSSLILPKAWYTYSGSQSGQLGKELQSADEDPTNSSNMVMFYTRDSVTKRGAGNGSGEWNREHVWPRSLSNNNWSTSNGGSVHAGVDILHVRPTWYDANETRGSTRYGDTNKTGVQKYNGMPYAYTSGSYFEPLDAVKGDVARILMYVWTAYIDYYDDPGLVVTKAIQSYDILLKWHTMDKPDQLEGHRNAFAETSKQKNRNPFVDHPEYAWQIFGEKVSQTVLNECKEAYPGNSGTIPPGPGGDSSSSNPGTSSDEINTSSNTPASSNNSSASSNNGRGGGMKKGCHGSVAITTLSVISLGSVVGLVFIFSKKKKK